MKLIQTNSFNNFKKEQWQCYFMGVPRLIRRMENGHYWFLSINSVNHLIDFDVTASKFTAHVGVYLNEKTDKIYKNKIC